MVTFILLLLICSSATARPASVNLFPLRYNSSSESFPSKTMSQFLQSKVCYSTLAKIKLLQGVVVSRGITYVCRSSVTYFIPPQVQLFQCVIPFKTMNQCLQSNVCYSTLTKIKLLQGVVVSKGVTYMYGSTLTYFIPHHAGSTLPVSHSLQNHEPVLAVQCLLIHNIQEQASSRCGCV